jgi:hypothetical protein
VWLVRGWLEREWDEVTVAPDGGDVVSVEMVLMVV